MRALDIVIPARGEGARIAPGLAALRDDGAGLRLRVIVVLNGEDAAETEATVGGFEAAFAQAGHELIVARSSPGKAQALNVGDGFRRGCPVIYLDADAIISRGFLAQFEQMLSGEAGPLLACPRFRVMAGTTVVNRAYGRVWAQLPIVRDGVIGGGCYAVNAAGRALWGAFPDISGDDAFVCALFPPGQRRAVSPASIQVVFPDRWVDLVKIRTRWRRSAREGGLAARVVRRARAAEPVEAFPSHLGASRWSTLLAPQLLCSTPFYLAVNFAAWLANLRARGEGSADWRPLRAG